MDKKMVNEEKVRLMTKLAIYEDKNEKYILPVTRYYRSDYISVQVMKSFFCGTVSFAMMLGAWALYGMEELMTEMFSMDLPQMGIAILIRYLAFISVYMVITYCVSSYRYAKGKQKVKKFSAMLKKVERMQEREEALRPSAEWES